MNVNGEFRDLLHEHHIEQQSLALKAPQEVLAYLREILPIENYLRKHCHDDKASNTLWNFSALYDESFTFKYTAGISSINVSRHFRHDPQKKHRLNFFNIAIVFEGEVELLFDESSILLREGDVVIISPDTLHALRAYNDSSVLVKYYVRRTTFERIFAQWLKTDNPLSDFFKHSLFECNSEGYIRFNTAGDTEFRDLALMLYAEHLNHRPYYFLICEAKMTELLCRLVRDHLDSISNTYFNERKLNLSRVIAYIQTNYESATLEEAARIAGYSKNHLCKIFRQAFGTNFNELLNRTRIDAAANLIVSTDMNINQIGEWVGYHSSEHFHRIFKAQKGCSPLKYRTENRVSEQMLE